MVTSADLATQAPIPPPHPMHATHTRYDIYIALDKLLDYTSRVWLTKIESRFVYFAYFTGLAPAAMQTFQWILEKDVSNKLAITGICKSMRKLGQWSRLHLLMSR